MPITSVNPNTYCRFIGGTPLTVNYNYTGTTDLIPGSVVVFGDYPLISSTGIKARPADALNAGLAVRGGWYEVTAAAVTTDITAGTKVYWDATNKRVTNAASGVHFGFVMNTFGEDIDAGKTGKVYVYHDPNGTTAVASGGGGGGGGGGQS